MLERVPFVSFVGMEGSGNSTVAKEVAKKIGFTYVSTGDMLREAARNDTGVLGEACRKMFEGHVYLSPQMLLEVVGNRLKRDDVDQGIVLDGGFRTLEETVDFQKMISTTSKDFEVKVFYLRVSKKECQTRLVAGRKRIDDTPEGVQRRITEFSRDLFARMKIIRERYSLEVIDGERPTEEICEEIISRLKKD